MTKFQSIPSLLTYKYSLCTLRSSQLMQVPACFFFVYPCSFSLVFLSSDWHTFSSYMYFMMSVCTVCTVYMVIVCIHGWSVCILAQTDQVSALPCSVYRKHLTLCVVITKQPGREVLWWHYIWWHCVVQVTKKRLQEVLWMCRTCWSGVWMEGKTQTISVVIFATGDDCYNTHPPITPVQGEPSIPGWWWTPQHCQDRVSQLWLWLHLW